MPKTRNSDAPKPALTLLAFAGLFGFAAYTQARVQIVDRKDVLDEAQAANRYLVERVDTARRGTIYSADGKALALSDDAFELSLSYRNVPRSPGFFMDLSLASGVPEAELRQPSELGMRSRTWRQTFSPEQKNLVQAVKRRWKADGVSLRPVLRRTYPMGALASGVVGSVREGRALGGLELSQNASLKGQDGHAAGYVDRTGFFLPTEAIPVVPRRNGTAITLTIDSELQRDATLAIRSAVERHAATSGCALVMDPKTGNLLAMANWPTYDPAGRIRKGEEFNAAYMNVLEPGSTFKILTLALGLEKGEVRLGETLVCGGRKEIVRGHFIHCDHGAHGTIDLQGAIAKSCNVCASTWALRVGREDMIQFLRDSGLLAKTSLGLPLETAGLFNFKDQGEALQLANVGFGQALNVTPVALLGAFAMLANDGIRPEPRLIQALNDRPVPIPAGKQIVKPEVAHAMLKIMEATIQSDYGTGKAARIPGYRLGGKTGTAQKVGAGGPAGYVSNFVGYVPAEAPRAVILVMVNDPKKGGYYGGEVALPVFTQLAKSVISRYQIPKSPTAPKAGGTLAP